MGPGLYAALGDDKVENRRAQELYEARIIENWGMFRNFVSKKGALEGVKGRGRGYAALGDDKIENGRAQEL